MGILAFVLVWPLIILCLGIGFISFFDVLDFPFSNFFVVLALIVVSIVYLVNRKPEHESENNLNSEESVSFRRFSIILSISIFSPVFLRYLVLAFNQSLAVILFGIVFGYGLFLMGFFKKDNQIIMRASMIGGLISLIYIYFEIWSLVSLYRILAAALGLLIAIVIASVKLKDKLK
ncbi:MAG: hypothetical protein EXS49_00965 [Candidatus Pacebacteria bacterium]|nr:hypothetical protein [Candidatus Paceibacterota bacterium]